MRGRDGSVAGFYPDEPPGDGYSIYPEDPRIFEAIYLGCNMEPKDAKNVVNLV